jgi:hypothetical protein
MTKTNTKPAAAAQQSNTSSTLIALGFDEHQKPRGARFEGADANLVTKAAQLMDLNVYEPKTKELAALARKLPIGRLYANGKAFVANIRQTLYSQIVVELAPEPGAAVSIQRNVIPAFWKAGSHRGRAPQSDRLLRCREMTLRAIRDQSALQRNDCYSITSSASAVKLIGTASPRALAVLELMTSSNFTGAWTGSSLGLAPFKMRST